jgi:hypothetical protein
MQSKSRGVRTRNGTDKEEKEGASAGKRIVPISFYQPLSSFSAPASASSSSKPCRSLTEPLSTTMKELVPEKGTLGARDEGVEGMGGGGCAGEGLVGGWGQGMRRKDWGAIRNTRDKMLHLPARYIAPERHN